MGKKAEDILADLKKVRYNIGHELAIAEESARINDENNRNRLAAYNAGQESGFNTTLELLDDLIGDWDNE